MSITKDFEARIQGKPGLAPYYLVQDCAALLAHARALEALLKEHEWTLCDNGEWECPECGGRQAGGHELDCQLAKLLEGVE